jgi:hypothetical protein
MARRATRAHTATLGDAARRTTRREATSPATTDSSDATRAVFDASVR